MKVREGKRKRETEACWRVCRAHHMLERESERKKGAGEYVLESIEASIHLGERKQDILERESKTSWREKARHLGEQNMT